MTSAPASVLRLKLYLKWRDLMNSASIAAIKARLGE